MGPAGRNKNPLPRYLSAGIAARTASTGWSSIRICDEKTRAMLSSGTIKNRLKILGNNKLHTIALNNNILILRLLLKGHAILGAATAHASNKNSEPRAVLTLFFTKGFKLLSRFLSNRYHNPQNETSQYKTFLHIASRSYVGIYL